jgi:hypothetical protein
MDIFEYTLKAILLRDLDVFFGLTKPLSVRFYRLKEVQVPALTLLSYLAYCGHSTQQEATAAFEAAVKALNQTAHETSLMVPPQQCTVQAFNAALQVLAETAPALKKSIFEALLVCIHYDGQITQKEGELIRAIAAMLAIPTMI